MKTLGARDIGAFLLELVALASVARWGWGRGGPLVALLTVLAFAGVWSTFLSPKAAVRLPVRTQAGLKLLLFSLISAGEWNLGWQIQALVLTVGALVLWGPAFVEG